MVIFQEELSSYTKEFTIIAKNIRCIRIKDFFSFPSFSKGIPREQLKPIISAFYLIYHKCYYFLELRDLVGEKNRNKPVKIRA